MRLLLSPAKRILFVAISLVAFALILLACSSFAQGNQADEGVVSNAIAVSANEGSQPVRRPESRVTSAGLVRVLPLTQGHNILP